LCRVPTYLAVLYVASHTSGALSFGLCQMPKIIVINAATEQMSGRDLSGEQRAMAAMSAWRNIWFARPGDVVVMPLQVHPEFLEYIGETMGFDPEKLTVVTPETSGLNVILTDELLLSSRIVDVVRARVALGGAWTVDPLYCTVGIAELAGLLGLGASTGHAFASQRGVDLLNRKTHFRQLAAGLALPIADGSLAHDPESLNSAICRHLGRTGTVILKKDNGAAGAGNVTLTKHDERVLAGTRETRKVDANLAAVAHELWAELTDSWNPLVVVEAYHAATHRFYLEYRIHEDGTASFLASGTIRARTDDNPAAKELIWMGLEVPAALPSSVAAHALSHATRFVLMCSHIGYRGPLNIDAIVSKEGDLIFNEVNARWGGGSVLHDVAERLLGKSYGNSYVVASLRNVPARAFSEAVQILRQQGLQFNPRTREGIVVLASNEMVPSSVEIITLAQTAMRVAELEASAVQALVH
jgi:hypothetical protein